ncbi:MAG: TOBE domain-containing protein, partial [Pseudomonadota bacterium]
GEVEQVGSPIELYERPRNTFVAQFIGSPKMNFFAPSALAPSAAPALREAGANAIVGIRSEHMTLCTSAEATVSATYELVENLGELALVHCRAQDGTEFIAKLPSPPNVNASDMLHFAVLPERAHVFDADTGLRT